MEQFYGYKVVRVVQSQSGEKYVSALVPDHFQEFCVEYKVGVPTHAPHNTSLFTFSILYEAIKFLQNLSAKGGNKYKLFSARCEIEKMSLPPPLNLATITGDYRKLIIDTWKLSSHMGNHYNQYPISTLPAKTVTIEEEISL